ncbi:MAG: hypothetical protein JO316_01380 [Abitibacteriaceae bacterium]|nr:hypothetical protein [Abditibacteriaceae bacterium]
MRANLTHRYLLITAIALGVTVFLVARWSRATTLNTYTCHFSDGSSYNLELLSDGVFLLTKHPTPGNVGKGRYSIHGETITFTFPGLATEGKFDEQGNIRTNMGFQSGYIVFALTLYNYEKDNSP